jgi:hypothetical protein
MYGKLPSDLFLYINFKLPEGLLRLFKLKFLLASAIFCTNLILENPATFQIRMAGNSNFIRW